MIGFMNGGNVNPLICIGICEEEEEMIRLKVEPDLYPEAVALLIEHGCEVERLPACLEVTLPEGSTREEIFFCSVLERYKLVLPDGLEMKEIYNRFVGRSALYFYIA
jgi:hypothetical protein